MDYKQYQYKILCEDRAQYHFVRGWLEHKGAERRKISCSGKLPHPGCGKQFVKDSFAGAVGEVRSVSSRTNTFLIVVIDADNLPVAHMTRDFPCQPNDPVFLVIPKWSIDTWARFLMNPDAADVLDEDNSCKKQYRNAKPAKLGRQLAEMDLSTVQGIPASLQHAYNNIKSKKVQLALN